MLRPDPRLRNLARLTSILMLQFIRSAVSFLVFGNSGFLQPKPEIVRLGGKTDSNRNEPNGASTNRDAAVHSWSTPHNPADDRSGRTCGLVPRVMWSLETYSIDMSKMLRMTEANSMKLLQQQCQHHSTNPIAVRPQNPCSPLLKM